jgi:hypothetical protein
MALKYALVSNPMTPDPNNWMAISSANQGLTLEDVIDKMISRGSTVTRAEALSVFEELSLAIELLVKDGNSINTPLFKISPTVSGTFASDDDSFDYKRHRVKLRLNPGVRLRSAGQNISVEKVASEKPKPVLMHFYDNTTGMQDETLTPGGAGRIVGNMLKYAEADLLQGIFFISVSNDTASRVTGKLLRNKPGELIFIIPPDIPIGKYRVEVRGLAYNSKTLRTGALPYELTVS